MKGLLSVFSVCDGHISYAKNTDKTSTLLHVAHAPVVTLAQLTPAQSTGFSKFENQQKTTDFSELKTVLFLPCVMFLGRKS